MTSFQSSDPYFLGYLAKERHRALLQDAESIRNSGGLTSGEEASRVFLRKSGGLLIRIGMWLRKKGRVSRRRAPQPRVLRMAR